MCVRPELLCRCGHDAVIIKSSKTTREEWRREEERLVVVCYTLSPCFIWYLIIMYLFIFLLLRAGVISDRKRVEGRGRK